jgi:hypothetical protein
VRDVRDLGRLLRTWLRQTPRQKRNWPLERVCDAAEAGNYVRPADLADDLDRVVKVTHLRRREDWGQVAGLVLLLLPLLWPAVQWGWQIATEKSAPLAGVLMVAALVALGLGVPVGAFTFVRGLVQRWRLGWRPGSRDVVLRFVTPVRLLPAVLALGLAGVVVGCDLVDGRRLTQVAGTALLLIGQVAGFWLLGAWAATLFTFLELLLRSVRSENPSSELPAGPLPG